MNPMQLASEKAAQLPKWPQRKLDHLPGDYGLPLFGHTFSFLRDYHQLLNQRERNYGRVYRQSLFFQRGVTLLGPDANEFVLRDQAHVFSSKAAWGPLLDELFGDGLMLRDFSDHKLHRRMLQQAFKKPALEHYMAQMNPRLGSALDQWPQKHSFSFLEQVRALLLGVGAETFFGLEMGADAERVNQAFVAEVDASLAVMRLNIPGTTWAKGIAGRRFLEKFIAGLIPARRAEGGGDFFSVLCRTADEESDATLSDQDIINHMIFLLFAAHDTTTSTLCSIIYKLATHSRWQETLRAEMQALDSDALRYEHLPQLPNTDWVFRETLRMHPPLTMVPRRTLEEVTFQGHRIPANTLVNISPLHTHYMESCWSDPYRFDPERFSPGRAEDKGHFFQWLPFGGGHHKCIGLNFAELQTKTFLFQLLRRYRISVAEHYQPSWQLVPLTVPKDGLPVMLTPL